MEETSPVAGVKGDTLVQRKARGNCMTKGLAAFSENFWTHVGARLRSGGDALLVELGLFEQYLDFYLRKYIIHSNECRDICQGWLY